MPAGLSGAFTVPRVGVINSGKFSPGSSMEAAIWVGFIGLAALLDAAFGVLSIDALKG